MTGTQSFDFDNQAANIGTCTRLMLGALEGILAGRPQARAVLLRSKFIIAELLNNAVKHSGTNNTIFTISNDDSCISIKKTDNGKPFNLYGKGKNEQQIVLSADAMHLLYAVLKNDDVHFYCKENFTIQPNVNELHEHMGLLIITKAADEFTYRHTEAENIFCAKLFLS